MTAQLILRPKNPRSFSRKPWAAVQMLALSDEGLQKKLDAYKAKMVEGVKEKNKNLKK